MDTKKPSIDDELKAAHRDKYLAQAEAAKSQKLLFDLEHKEKSKLYSKSWIKKKETWAILIGTLVAWTAVGFYITTSIIPLSEIHNNQVTLENTKKSDTLYDKEKQLKSAYDTLKREELNLAILSTVVNEQRNDNNKLKVARHNLDSSYSMLSKLYKNQHFISLKEIQSEFSVIEKNIADYNQQLKEQANNSVKSANIFSFPSSWAGLNYVPNTISKAAEDDKPLFDMASNHSDAKLNGIEWYSSIPSFKEDITSPPRITLRPLFNGTLIANLTIHVYSVPTANPLTGSQITFQFPYDNLVGYSEEGKYTLTGPLMGYYAFEIKGSQYKIATIRSSENMMTSDGNKISIPYLGLVARNSSNVTIDLNLTKD